MTKVTKKFHSDNGHGWLAVKRKELVEMNIMKNISPWSYIKGNTIYLEEDGDAEKYLIAMEARNIKVDIISLPQKEHSPIRNYDSFSNPMYKS